MDGKLKFYLPVEQIIFFWRNRSLSNNIIFPLFYVFTIVILTTVHLLLSFLLFLLLKQGYFLLYESMLDTVLFARDKYLAPGGIIFPDKAIMYVCAMEDAQMKNDRIHFWENVYGFDMSPIKEIALSEPIVDVVDCNTIMTNTVPILKLDLLTCTKENAMVFSSDFILVSNRNDYIHGIVAYFECAFTQVHKPMGWSTSPFSKYTHWKQTIFYLRETIVICQGEHLAGKITCCPNKKNPRDLDIQLQIKFDGTHCKLNCSQSYRLR